VTGKKRRAPYLHFKGKRTSHLSEPAHRECTETNFRKIGSILRQVLERMPPKLLWGEGLFALSEADFPFLIRVRGHEPIA
jgi:hypothetical protein